jgi:hypothetical protein
MVRVLVLLGVLLELALDQTKHRRALFHKMGTDPKEMIV